MAKYPALMLWTDAYLADTRHLSTSQHGAYLLILMTMWRTNDCTLPDDDTYLASITCMDVRTWKKNRPTIETFLQHTEGGRLTQKRLLEERKFADQISARRSLSGREGARARWLNDNGKCHSDAIDLPIQSDRQKMAIPQPTQSNTDIRKTLSGSSTPEDPEVAEHKRLSRYPPFEVFEKFCRNHMLAEGKNPDQDWRALFDILAAPGWRMANGNPIVDWKAKTRSAIREGWHVPKQNGNGTNGNHFITRDKVVEWCHKKQCSKLADRAWGQLMSGRYFGRPILTEEDFKGAMAAIHGEWLREP